MQRQIFHYSISELVPYVNWEYFYHAWQLKDHDEQQRIKAEAIDRMASLNDRYHVHAVVAVADAYADGDDIMICKDRGEVSGDNADNCADNNDKCADKAGIWRLPMLRQQTCREGQPCLCLADYVRPLDAVNSRPLDAVNNRPADKVGLFAASVDIGMETDFACDSYQCMMTQLIADRLAEAAAEVTHLAVRTDLSLWGYAPDEHLTIPQLHSEQFVGIRPAVGYPSMPDASINFLIDDIIGFKEIGIRLTPSGAMKPHASVSGLMISHPKARYFSVGKIGEDQVIDYSRRRRVPVEIMRRFLAANI